MYLSRLILNPRSRQVQRELAYPYQMHRTILNAFPAELPTDERVLFRLEEEPQQAANNLLVQSVHRPDWSFLSSPEKNYLLPTELARPGEENPSVKSFELRLKPNQILSFRLKANPTVKKDRPGVKQGHRVGIYDQQGQIKWLERKAHQAGFVLLRVQTSQDSKLKDVIHREGKSDERLVLCSVQFDGVLKVFDVQKVTDAVRNGIGSGKSFGFGLLSLAPAIT